MIQEESDLDQLEERLTREPTARLGVVAQTTQPLEKVLELVEALRARFPEAEVRFIDTVCQPTKDRQRALRRLAAETDVVVVVGGPESNNSRKLAELARASAGRRTSSPTPRNYGRSGSRAANWSGLTAGTSTPDPIIQDVRTWLERLPARRTAAVG